MNCANLDSRDQIREVRFSHASEMFSRVGSSSPRQGGVLDPDP